MHALMYARARAHSKFIDLCIDLFTYSYNYIMLLKISARLYKLSL